MQMEMQGTQNSQNNLEKKTTKSEDSHFQISKPSKANSNEDSVILA